MTLNVGLPLVIKEYFGNGSAFGVKIEYSFEQQILGTASGIVNFRSQLKDEPFFVIYGDNFSKFDLLSLINFSVFLNLWFNYKY